MDPVELGWFVRAWARGCVPIGFALLTACTRGTMGSASGETGSSSDGSSEDTGDEQPWHPCPEGVAGFTVANSQTEVDALVGCVEVSGDLDVGMCYFDPQGSCEIGDPVNSVRPLSALTTVTGDLSLRGEDGWASLEGLESLHTIGGELRIGAPPLWEVAFDDLGPLSGLRSVGALQIYGAPYLTTLSPLSGWDAEKLQQVDIDSVPQLSSIEALRGVRAVSYVSLTNLPALQSLEGLEDLEMADGIGLESLGITSLQPVSSIPSPLNSVAIQNCPHVTAIEGFHEQTTIEFIYLEILPSVESFDAFSGVTESTLISLRGFDSLPEPIEFAALQRVKTLQLWSGVRDLRLPSLEHIETLEMASGELAHLSAPSLVSTDGSLSIGGTDGALVLEFSALQRVNGDLWLNANLMLSNLDGFPALNEVAGDLHIRDNPKLSTALAEAFAAGIDVEGEVLIENNGF